MTNDPATVDRLELTGQVRAALAGMFDIEGYAWSERGALTIRGQLLGPAQALYRRIRQQMEALGFTPFLRRNGTQDELVAFPGVLKHTAPRVGLPVVLFLLTMLTSVLTGALRHYPLTIPPGADGWGEIRALYQAVGAMLLDPAALLRGVPFAATVLGILFTHEMGHYVVGRLRQAPVSLPYFIPIPPGLSFTGTLGAVIVQREPMEDRQTILEVGIAGPLAGLVVAIPLLLYGLATSSMSAPTPEMLSIGYIQEGNSLLYAAAKFVVFGRWLPENGIDVQLNDVAFGAWIGLLLTMLNMLPVGQLDGGHVAYALFGSRARYLAYAMIALCGVLGVLVSPAWLFWGLLTLLVGARHPAPLNDISPLAGRHIALALFGLLVFVLLFMPNPLVQVLPT